MSKRRKLPTRTYAKVGHEYLRKLVSEGLVEAKAETRSILRRLDIGETVDVGGSLFTYAPPDVVEVIDHALMGKRLALELLQRRFHQDWDARIDRIANWAAFSHGYPDEPPDAWLEIQALTQERNAANEMKGAK